jgi:molybdate transport system substrate-binding protein
MHTHAMRIVALVLAVAFVPAAAGAAEIKIISSNALKSTLEELGPQFEKANAHKLVFQWGAVAGLLPQIEKGEPFDVTVLTTGAIDGLARQGKIDGATRAALARSSIGVAVRKGAPRPDISTTEAFKRTLLNAKTIAYVEQGQTGIYLKDLFVKLGIADQIRPKLKFAPTAAAEFVGRGEAEIGMTQISEILPFPDSELVGPLPADIQLYTNFSTAAGSAAKEPEAARALIRFLTSPQVAPVLKAKGLDPA